MGREKKVAICPPHWGERTRVVNARESDRTADPDVSTGDRRVKPPPVPVSVPIDCGEGLREEESGVFPRP